MFNIEIKGLKEFSSKMNDVVKKQIPFATSRALNKTAEDIRKEELSNLEKKFTLRKPWYKPGTKLGINVKKSHKTNLTAEVYTRAPFMKLHETGGTKKPRSGKYIAIPTTNIKRTKKGLIGKAKRPRNLKRSFWIKSRTGQEMLMQRKSKRKVEVAYMMEPKADIKATFEFKKTGKRVAEQKFKKNFEAALDDALRTAK